MSVATAQEPATVLGELKLHRLLVAIDGSANAELALIAAITAARRDNATITLITVGPDVATGPAAWSVPVAGTIDQGSVDDDCCKRLRATVARIPADRRRVITSHEAFGYFERAYGIDFVAPQGVSTDAEASAKDVARIIQQIRKERIPAVFVETIADPRLIRRIAEETGARIGERLYSDALSGPDGPAATYIDMMRHNIRALAAALAG